MKNHYEELKDSYIIFICLEDIFKKGLPLYRFEECTGITLDEIKNALNAGLNKNNEQSHARSMKHHD